MNEILNILKKDYDITNLSNFKTKAIARYYYEVNCEDCVKNLSKIYNFCKNNDLNVLFIGGGTNMLFAFDKYDGVVIKNNLNGWSYNEDTKILESSSNELISDIAEKLESDYNQKLWHRFIGLPGSLGGAVFGNAGCFGLETENNFLKANILDLESGEIKEFSKDDMDFGYRSSIVKIMGRFFIIDVTFDLSKKVEKYHSDVDNLYFRENKQPKGNTCGSFFKNPSREQSAGFLIEEVGLKGYKIGGAYFSEKHANFLMNDGTCTYKDLLELIDLAKTKIRQKFNIDIINEVRIIKN